MHLKRYRMPTVQEALAKVREDLGPRALVLSTRLVPRRGPAGWFGSREVEITAAADRPQVSENRPAETGRRPAAETAKGPDHEIVARLTAAGLDPALAQRVYEAVPRSARRAASVPALRKALAECLRDFGLGAEPFAPVEVFVGPPGAGKTTTIAKIAAQERARHGRRVGLVAADGFRVGAVEQLRLYADIIGTSFRVVRATSEMEQVFSKPSSTPVLVDTAGRSPRDRAARSLFDLLAGRKDVRIHLVIPASTPAPSLDRVLAGFGECRPDRVALTRLDECESTVPVINALRDRGLALSYLGIGQRVPEDLARATPAVLAASLLGEDVRLVGDAA
jgi:flagellar biosynthesis protein FlhF